MFYQLVNELDHIAPSTKVRCCEVAKLSIYSIPNVYIYIDPFINLWKLVERFWARQPNAQRNKLPSEYYPHLPRLVKCKYSRNLSTHVVSKIVEIKLTTNIHLLHARISLPYTMYIWSKQRVILLIMIAWSVHLFSPSICNKPPTLDVGEKLFAIIYVPRTIAHFHWIFARKTIYNHNLSLAHTKRRQNLPTIRVYI